MDLGELGCEVQIQLLRLEFIDLILSLSAWNVALAYVFFFLHLIYLQLRLSDSPIYTLDGT